MDYYSCHHSYKGNCKGLRLQKHCDICKFKFCFKHMDHKHGMKEPCFSYNTCHHSYKGNCKDSKHPCGICKFIFCYEHMNHNHGTQYACYWNNYKCNLCYKYFCKNHKQHKHAQECSYINCNRIATRNGRCVYHGNRGVMYDSHGNITYHGMP